MADKGMGLLLMGPPEKESDDGETGSGSMSAAKALIKALKAGDAASVDEALKLHYDLCEAEKGSGYEDEE